MQVMQWETDMLRHVYTLIGVKIDSACVYAGVWPKEQNHSRKLTLAFLPASRKQHGHKGSAFYLHYKWRAHYIRD